MFLFLGWQYLRYIDYLGHRLSAGRNPFLNIHVREPTQRSNCYTKSTHIRAHSNRWSIGICEPNHLATMTQQWYYFVIYINRILSILWYLLCLVFLYCFYYKLHSYLLAIIMFLLQENLKMLKNNVPF